MRIATFALLVLFILPVWASDEWKGPQCHELGFMKPRQDPSEEVLEVVKRLVKRTKTETGECSPAMSVPNPQVRLCGVTAMSQEKFRKRVEAVFLQLGPTLRDPWRDQSGSSVGGFVFVDPLSKLIHSGQGDVWGIVASVSHSAQPDLDPANVSFTVCGSGVSMKFQSKR